LLVISILISPRVTRDKDVAGDVGAAGRDTQTEGGIGVYLNVIKRSTDGGADHRSGVVDVDALADAIRATAPASVDEVAAHVVFLDALTEQVCIFAWAQWQEGCAKAGTERCLRSGDTSFSTG